MLSKCYWGDQMQGMRWAGNVARMGVKRNSCRGWWGKLEGYRPLENLGINGRIILKWLLNGLEGVD
jgi:hypothetical protein